MRKRAGLFLAAILAVFVIAQGGLSWHGPHVFASPLAPPMPLPGPEQKEAYDLYQANDASRDEMPANLGTYEVSGESTAGSVIIIKGKEIQLPPDVYVAASLICVLCVQGMSCPETPLVVLQYKGTDDALSVSERSGKIYDQMSSDEENKRVRAKFSWLEKELRWNPLDWLK